MNYPDYRPRRMRRTDGLRRMIRETRLSVDDFVYPLFVVPGSGVEKPIGSLPGQFNYSAVSGFCTARFTSALSRSTIAAGVPVGA